MSRQSTNAYFHFSVSDRQSLPISVGVVLVFLFFFATVSFNPLLSVFALIVELVIFYQLWLPGQPPVLFVGMSIQWLQSSTRILQANLAGNTLEEYDKSGNAELAVWASLISILLLAIVIGRVIRNTPFNRPLFLDLLRKVDLNRTFLLYLACLIILPSRIFFGGSFAQILLSIFSIKWTIYCILAFAVLHRGEKYHLLLIPFFVELILGFSGYFSNFKDVILYTIIAVGAFRHKIQTKTFFLATPLAIGLFLLLAVWTSVKRDYRSYVRGGLIEGPQAVLVSRQDALAFLWNSATSLDAEEFELGIQGTLDRIQYTRMIQWVMDYVPAVKNHENGTLWKNAVLHVFTPRFLFPDKGVLDDSAIAREYTGFEWRGIEQGVSISIGYIAESYVDFGFPGMFIPMIFLGLLLGYIYRLFLSMKGDSILLFTAAVIPIFFQFQLIERSGNKLIGGILMMTLVYLFIMRPFLFGPIYRFLLRR